MRDIEHEERRHLAACEQHIAQGETLIAGQTALVERLRAKGEETTLAESLLAALQASQDQHRAHRRLILERVARLGQAAGRT